MKDRLLLLAFINSKFSGVLKRELCDGVTPNTEPPVTLPSDQTAGCHLDFEVSGGLLSAAESPRLVFYESDQTGAECSQGGEQIML